MWASSVTQANAFLSVRQDISIKKANVVQSLGENSPVPLWIVLIPQVQERSSSRKSGMKANKD